MVKHNFIVLIFLLLNSIKLSISNIFPVKKIIFTNDIYNLHSSRTIQWNLESRGYGIIFNDKLNISLIPKNLFLDIYNFYSGDEQVGLRTKTYEDGTEEMLINTYIEGDNYETTHFILEKMGISIPIKYFLIGKEEHELYGLVFLTKENQEYIEFGKNLIDVMNIEFPDEKNFVIHNEEFIIKFNE